MGIGMKVISFEDIKNLNITPLQCYEWVEDAIKNKKQTILPPKTHINMEGNIFCNVMPSVIRIDGKKIGGVKIVTRYPKRNPSLDSKIILFDADTGDFLAIMDANWITALRTGAVAAHSIRTFANPDFIDVGMIGLGNTARATLLILQAIYPTKEMNIRLLKYKDQAELFRDEFERFDNLKFTIHSETDDIIDGADVVISCATYFENDICADQHFKEGVLVVPVHTRGFTNCDLFFDKIYADDTGHVDHFKNFSKFRFYAEVADVVNGNAAGRESEKERILAYNIGLSIHDVYYAYKILKMSDMSEMKDIDFAEPKTKFWV